MSELIYGRHAVLESLRAARRQVYRLWLEESAQTKSTGILSDILALAEEASLPTRTIEGGLFEKLARQHVNPQGIALEVGDYPYVDLEAIIEPSGGRRAAHANLSPLILILDHIQDPQNLGTLFRTAEAMAVDGIILPERRAAGITPAVVNASSGAVEHLNIVRLANLNRAIEELKEESFWVAGLEDTDDAIEPNPRMLDGTLAVVIGSEGDGLSRLTREKCDYLVRLPMYGKVESLNAAVAGSIMLYWPDNLNKTQSNMHLKLVFPSASTWNAEIDRLGALLDAQNNPTVFPYHFLQVVLPSIGGAMVEVLSDDTPDSRYIAVGFLLPRGIRNNNASKRVYTFRYHLPNRKESKKKHQSKKNQPGKNTTDREIDEAVVQEMATRICKEIGAAEVVAYTPQGSHLYTATESVVGNARIGHPSASEAERVRELHMQIWNSPPEYLYPSDIHSDGFRLGTSLVARVEDQVAAFLFGFHRFDGPPLPDMWRECFNESLRLESQVMGVAPNYRGLRLASLLKRAQAQDAMAQGIDLIHWTADPLMYPNAALNFGLLRAVAFNFRPDYYPFRNDLNRVPASRLVMTWLINSERVSAVPLIGSSALILELRPNFERVNDGYKHVRLEADADYIAIEIPGNWGEIQQADIETALRWRRATDRLLEHYLGIDEGKYVITGVAVDDEKRFLICQHADEYLWKRLAQ